MSNYIIDKINTIRDRLDEHYKILKEVKILLENIEQLFYQITEEKIE